LGSNLKPLSTGFLGKYPLDPVPSEVGQWWYNSTDKAYKYYDGSSIKNLGEEVYVSPTPPTNPKGGTLWWDTIEKRLKVYLE